MPRRRGVFWRAHLQDEVVDLRAMGQRKRRSENLVSAAPRPPAEAPRAQLAASASDEAMRYLASLPPEVLQEEGIYTEDQLREYAEALRFSSRHKATPRQTHLASSPESTEVPPQKPNPPVQKQERAISAQELADELARIEDEDTQLEEQFSQPLQDDSVASAPLPEQESTPFVAEEPAVEEAPPVYQQEAQLRSQQRLASIDFAPQRRVQLRQELGRRPRRLGRLFAVLGGALLILPLGAAAVLAVSGDQLQERALSDAQEAYVHMEAGKEALLQLDHETARQRFADARLSFERAQGVAGPASRLSLRASTLLPFDTKVASAARLLEAGTLYASAGEEAALALAQVRQGEEGSQDAIARTDAIVAAIEHLNGAREYFERANTVLAYVRPGDLPEEFSQNFATVQQQTHEVELLLEDAYTSLPIVLDLLGHQESKRYLFLFQNSSELRPTGGFIGTYGTLTLEGGRMEELFINGIYDPDGQLKEKIVPPTPLQYVTPNWGTRDSNWFFDFPTSARTAMSFFEKTGNGTVDGVIAMTPYVAQELLRITGPVEMPQYGVSVSAENFLEVVQEEVEQNYDKELNKPKQILADMAPVLIERALSGEHTAELLSVLTTALEQKHVLIYSTSEDSQDFLLSRGWGGAVEAPQSGGTSVQDYLAVVLSNIGGWKTDVYTDTSVDSTTRIEEDGSITRTVWISRKHTGGNTSYVWYDKPNVGYVRFYVPKGAELIDANGFSPSPPLIRTDYAGEGYERDTMLARVEATASVHEASGMDVFEETGLTVFGDWLRINPGEEKVAHITYRLPAPAPDSAQSYSLTIQKQPGLDVSYSGNMESARTGLIFSSCRVGEEALTAPRFNFEQKHDETISCAL